MEGKTFAECLEEAHSQNTSAHQELSTMGTPRFPQNFNFAFLGKRESNTSIEQHQDRVVSIYKSWASRSTLNN
jgi:hypothetical protein